MFNTKVRLLLIAFMLFSAILHYPTPAWACSCVRPGSPQEEFVRTEAVFVGTVTEAESGRSFWNPLYGELVRFYHQLTGTLPPIDSGEFHGRAISFKVEHSWRGVKTTQITLQTGWDSADCGYPFQEGKQYLVYADKWGDEALHASSCSRTTAVASATQDLNYLQTVPKLELTYISPMLNWRMLCLAIPLVSAIVLGVVIWRRHRIKTS